MIRTLTTATALLFFAACNNNPTENKAKAVVGQPALVAAAPAAGAVQFQFSEQGSSIGFVGAKITGKHQGSFGKFAGTIDVVGSDPTRSTVTVVIDTSSISTDQEKLTGHLKSPDFFDAAKFPQIRFTSTSIVAGGEGGATHRVTGNLEMHGITKSIAFPATIRLNAGAADIDSEFGINRKDFGLVYPGKPDDLIKDEVLIQLKIAAKPR